MKKTMKRQEVIELSGKFERLKASSIKLAWSIVQDINKNCESLKNYVKDMIGVESKMMEDYNKKRDAICISFAKKDKNGKPIFITTQGAKRYDISDENKDEFKKAFDALREESTDLFSEREKFLNEEIEIGLKSIKQGVIPDGLVVEAWQGDVLMSMIEE